MKIHRPLIKAGMNSGCQSVAKFKVIFPMAKAMDGFFKLLLAPARIGAPRFDKIKFSQCNRLSMDRQ